jgi:hypothetical protein
MTLSLGRLAPSVRTTHREEVREESGTIEETCDSMHTRNGRWVALKPQRSATRRRR